MLSNKYWVKEDYHFPGCASAETAQDAVGFPYCQADCWLILTAPMIPRSFLTSCSAAIQYPACIIARVIPSQVQDFPFPHAKFHKVMVDLFLQPI